MLKETNVLTSILDLLQVLRRQVTSIPPVDNCRCNRPTVIPNVAATPGMHESIMTQAQEGLATTTNLGTATIVDQEVSVPETTQPATTANNKSQLGASYLNSPINIPNSNISVCSSDSFVQENLNMLLNEKLNDKIDITLKEIFSNVNLDGVSE